MQNTFEVFIFIKHTRVNGIFPIGFWQKIKGEFMMLTMQKLKLVK